MTTTLLPDDYIAATAEGFIPKVEEYQLADNVKVLIVSPRTKILIHDHKGNPDWDWEVYIWMDEAKTFKQAHYCAPGESHALVNNTDACVSILAIKGKSDNSAPDKYNNFIKAALLAAKLSVHTDDLIIP